MKNIVLLLVLCLLSCNKENIDITNKDRSKFLGYFCGELITDGNSTIYNTEIKKSSTDSNKILIDSIEAIVEGNTITIPEVTSHVDNYDLIIEGYGVLDTTNYHLQINITIKVRRIDQPEMIVTQVLNLYKPNVLTYEGTYTGDSATVVISSVNDQLYAAITFETDMEPYGWENILIQDEGCYLKINTDSINEIASGEYYKLQGSGLKLGDHLRFHLQTYYHCISPLNIYDFNVIKNQ